MIELPPAAALDAETARLLAEIDVLDRRGALDDRDRAELAAAAETRRRGEMVARAFETMALASVEMTRLLFERKS